MHRSRRILAVASLALLGGLLLGPAMYYFISISAHAGSISAHAAPSSAHAAKRSVKNYRGTYTVGSETSLGEISVRLYGTTRHWKKIAKWNQLKKPYPLEKDQILVIKMKPRVTLAEGDRILLEMWRKRLARAEANAEESIAKKSKADSEREKKELARAEREKKALEKKELARKKAEERELAKKYAADKEFARRDMARRAKLAKEEEKIRLAEEAKARALAIAAEKARIEAERLAEKKRLDAEMLERLRQEALAADEESAEVQTDPESPEVLFSEGQKLLEDKNYEAALVKVKRARELNDEPLPPWFYEIRLLRLLKREDEAKDVARKLIKERPEIKGLPMFKFLGEETSG